MLCMWGVTIATAKAEGQRQLVNMAMLRPTMAGGVLIALAGSKGSKGGVQHAATPASRSLMNTGRVSSPAVRNWRHHCAVSRRLLSTKAAAR